MAIRKVGNIYQGNAGLRKVGNIFQSGEETSQGNKSKRLEEARARAEAARIEAERLNSFSGLAGETAKGIVGMGVELGKGVIGSTAAVGADVVNRFNPLVQAGVMQPIQTVNMFGNEYTTPTENERQAKEVFKSGEYKKAIGKEGEALLDVATTFFTPFKGAQVLKGGAFTKGFIQGGTAAAPIVAGYGAANALSEGKGAYDTAKDTVIGGLAGFGGGGILGGTLAKLALKFAGNPRRDIGAYEAEKVVNTVDETIGRATTPQEEDAILEAMSRGASSKEIVEEVTKASGNAQKSTVEAPKQTSGTEVPKEPAEDPEASFLKAVEDRFAASKREKFREATRDEQGKFTGSQKGGAIDAERDALAESIQNRIDSITDDSIPSYSAREDLRAIQEQVARAKTDDLARLKVESDRIADELIKSRAEKVRPVIEKEKKVAAVRSIARDSDTFTEFQLNLKKRGEDITTIFKSKPAAEEFFRKNSGAKYRTADPDSGLLQEARKYKSAEEFVGAMEKRIANDKAYSGLYERYQDNFNLTKKATPTSVPDESARGFVMPNFSGIDIKLKDFEINYPFADKAKILKNKETGEILFYVNPKTDLNKLPKKLISLMEYSNKSYNKKPYFITQDGGKTWSTLETSSIDNVKLQSQSKSQLTDIWKKAQGESGKFRDIATRFEQMTGTKLTPEQELKIKELNKKLFGDENVEVTAQILTPNGQKAFGEYKNKVIKILDGQADPTDTFYHEAVHKYLDLFTTLDEQKKIYVEARKLWKTDNLDDLEEKIAENFIRYAKTNEGVVGTMKVLFDKVIERIKTAIGGESSIEALYKDILEGKAKQVKEVKVASVEPKKTVEKPVVKPDEVTKKPKVSVIASRLNEALPEGMKIDETYEPKVIQEELDKAASAIEKNKEKAIQKAFDPNTNPVERDAILIELSEIAKRDGDYAAVADLFQRRTELIRSGAQSLNMEKASVVLNPQEKYMRDIVNARLSKVKVNGKDLTDVEVATIRKSVRKETTEATKKAFKIQDAQELFNSLIC